MAKIIKAKARIIAFLGLFPLAVILAFVPENTTKPYKLTAEELLDEVTEGIQFISTDQVADLIINEDPSVLIIDVRPQDEYEYFHIPGSINIPLSDILSEEWEAYLDQDVRTNIFYSNGNTKANEAWMITRQLGYENCYVMQGGLNYWAETIQNPEKPASTSPDDEFAKYDFRKGASKVFGGGELEDAEQDVFEKPDLPPVVNKDKKKRAQGGC